MSILGRIFCWIKNPRLEATPPSRFFLKNFRGCIFVVISLSQGWIFIFFCNMCNITLFTWNVKHIIPSWMIWFIIMMDDWIRVKKVKYFFFCKIETPFSPLMNHAPSLRLKWERLWNNYHNMNFMCFLSLLSDIYSLLEFWKFSNIL